MVPAPNLYFLCPIKIPRAAIIVSFERRTKYGSLKTKTPITNGINPYRKRIPAIKSRYALCGKNTLANFIILRHFQNRGRIKVP